MFSIATICLYADRKIQKCGMKDCRRMTTLYLSLILTVSFVLRVTDGQGEVTERVCVSYITSVLI